MHHLSYIPSSRSDYILTEIFVSTYFPHTLVNTLNYNIIFLNQPGRGTMAAVARKMFLTPSKLNHPFICFLAVGIFSFIVYLCFLSIFFSNLDSFTLHWIGLYTFFI